MVDEDFVMGYAVGYNDGVCSGGGGSGGSGLYGDVVIAKRYRFGDSGYGIATIDFNKSARCRGFSGCASSSVPNGDTVTMSWGPTSTENIEWGYAMTKGDDIIGFLSGYNTVGSNNYNWLYDKGQWVLKSQTVHEFGECTVIYDNGTYYLSMAVDGTVQTCRIASRRADPQSGYISFSVNSGYAPLCSEKAEYEAWWRAFGENGITFEEV